ncbi:hypothetical protein [Brachyspira pulli]|uniref:hypothetical protein n=1 Tax=Brachyspira pulli TaxID=310721 RepID=UPI0030072511
MSFYEEMYYNLPESERETFVNSLSDEDRKSLMLALNKNNLCSNISSKHKSRFDSIYNELKDEKTKKSFIDIFNYLDEDKREILLDIVFNNMNKEEKTYIYPFDYLKNIMPEHNEKIYNYFDSIKFRRVLRCIIDIKLFEVLEITAKFELKNVDNSIFRITSFINKYNYKNKNNEKLLNMLYNIPEEKRIYFFEEFEKNEDFKNTEFIKMLKIVLNMDRKSFLSIFERKENIFQDKIIRFVDYNHINVYMISFIFNNFQSITEQDAFVKILESIISFKINQIINIFDNLDENMQESVIHFSSIVVLEKLEDYINLFSNVSNKSEKNAKETQINDNKLTYNNNATSIDNDIYIEYLSKCKAKLTEISWLIEDFEYAIKEDYKNSCKEIESIIDSGIENKDKFNKIIDHINNIYKNAYYKKHNKSSLAFIMDEDDEDIKYIEYIN